MVLSAVAAALRGIRYPQKCGWEAAGGQVVGDRVGPPRKGSFVFGSQVLSVLFL